MSFSRFTLSITIITEIKGERKSQLMGFHQNGNRGKYSNGDSISDDPNNKQEFSDFGEVLSCFLFWLSMWQEVKENLSNFFIPKNNNDGLPLVLL